MPWSERVLEQTMRDDDTRSESDRDYARIIHSAAFRRLQSKTQVLGLGESDFYRTRLTHSMEVCQIGVGLMKFLEIKYYGMREIRHVLPDASMIGAICLAHDIGHPPFGHGGEAALNKCMMNEGGFEANAQTLRILSELEPYTEKNGLNPTRRLYLGILKYPAPYSKVINKNLNEVLASPPKCYFDSEKGLIDWVLKPLNENERKLFQTVIPVDNANNKTIYRSMDTSIMEISDDISYGLHDFEDAVSINMITREHWQSFFDDKKELFTACKLDFEEISKNLFSEYYKRKDAIGKLINKMITGVEIRCVEGFDTPLVKYNASLKENSGELLSAFKKIVKKLVIKNENVRQLDFKGQNLIKDLFDVFTDNPECLLSDEQYSFYIDSGKNNRIVCDFIAGMTDGHAVKMYEKLFIPGKGSIFDRG